MFYQFGIEEDRAIDGFWEKVDRYLRDGPGFIDATQGFEPFEYLMNIRDVEEGRPESMVNNREPLEVHIIGCEYTRQP